MSDWELFTGGQFEQVLAHSDQTAKTELPASKQKFHMSSPIKTMLFKLVALPKSVANLSSLIQETCDWPCVP